MFVLRKGFWQLKPLCSLHVRLAAIAPPRCSFAKGRDGSDSEDDPDFRRSKSKTKVKLLSKKKAVTSNIDDAEQPVVKKFKSTPKPKEDDSDFEVHEEDLDDDFLDSLQQDVDLEQSEDDQDDDSDDDDIDEETKRKFLMAEQRKKRHRSFWQNLDPQKKSDMWQQKLQQKKEQSIARQMRKTQGSGEGKRKRLSLRSMKEGALPAPEKRKLDYIEKELSLVRGSDIPGEVFRVISLEGKLIGDMPKGEAIVYAKKQGYDLALIRRTSDFSLVRFKEANVSQLTRERTDLMRKAKFRPPVKIVTKEIRLNSLITKHDMDVKFTTALKLMEKGNLVFVALDYRAGEVPATEVMPKMVEDMFSFFGDRVKLAEPPNNSSPMKKTFAFVHSDPAKAPPLGDLEEYIVKSKSSTVRSA